MVAARNLPARVAGASSVELVEALAVAARQPATRRAYAADWRAFAAWCEGLPAPACPAPPFAVASWIAELASRGRAYATITRALAAIAVVHRQRKQASPRAYPLVRDTLRGIQRTIGVAPRNQKAAISVAQLRRIVLAVGETTRIMASVRDRAILVFGFAGGFRRSELAAFDVGDVCRVDQGLQVTIRRSKTDPEGAGRVVGVPFGSEPSTCPVRTLETWLRARGPAGGAIFRQLGPYGAQGERMSPRAIGEVVKRAVALAGLDAKRYGGHSLRAGLCTAAAQAGKGAAAIMAQTGHRSAAMVLRYVRAGTMFDDNAASGIGL